MVFYVLFYLVSLAIPILKATETKEAGHLGEQWPRAEPGPHPWSSSPRIVPVVLTLWKRQIIPPRPGLAANDRSGVSKGVGQGKGVVNRVTRRTGLGCLSCHPQAV
jgi:hypothetical protein